jgi:hypothetical protein
MAELKFKVGDTVRIREDLDVSHGIRQASIVPAMMSNRGGIYKISSLNTSYYSLAGIGYSWPEAALELVPTFKPGDKVRIRPDIATCSTTEGIKLLQEMHEYAGRTGNVIGKEGLNSHSLTGIGYYWHPNWLELVTEVEVTKSSNDHLLDSLSYAVPNLLTKEINTMNTEIKHVDFINGKDATEFTPMQQIDCIKAVEAEINELTAYKTKSKAVEARIAELKAFIEAAVKLWDAAV